MDFDLDKEFVLLYTQISRLIFKIFQKERLKNSNYEYFFPLKLFQEKEGPKLSIILSFHSLMSGCITVLVVTRLNYMEQYILSFV